MAETDDVVLVDCQCGRHSNIGPVGKPKPKPGKKPRQLSGQVLTGPGPIEEHKVCNHRISNNDLEAMLAPSIPLPNAPFSFNDNGPPPKLHNAPSWNNRIPSTSAPKPPVFSMPAPPPPPPMRQGPPGPIPVPLPHRPKPNRHRRPDSVDSYESSSDESIISVRRRGGRNMRRALKSFPFVEMSNHIEMMEHSLLSVDDTRSYRAGKETGSCSAFLHPFGRRAYVNSITFSPVDMKKYFWLIQFAEPETWYLWPSKQLMTQMTALGESGLSSKINEQFAPIANNPKALSVPRICLGPSLLEKAACNIDGLSDDDLSDEEYYPRSRARRSILPKPGLRYYSVQQSEEAAPYFNRAQEHKDAENHTLPIYRVVVHGSWDAATAQAFYDAGANGWSTIFTCTMTERVGENLGIIKGLNAFERADRFWELLEPGTIFENEKHKIFY